MAVTATTSEPPHVDETPIQRTRPLSPVADVAVELRESVGKYCFNVGEPGRDLGYRVRTAAKRASMARQSGVGGPALPALRTRTVAPQTMTGTSLVEKMPGVVPLVGEDAIS